jgi:DNA gyrase/topoisomerase IV subunit A
MAMTVADQPGAFVLDLTTSRELAELEGRLHALEAQLDALGRLEQVNKVIQFSQNKQCAAVALQHEPFGYSAEQAKVVLAMPMSWQCADTADQLRAERKGLLARRASICQTPTEASSANWFG